MPSLKGKMLRILRGNPLKEFGTMLMGSGRKIIVDYLYSYLISGVSPSVCHLYPKALSLDRSGEGC